MINHIRNTLQQIERSLDSDYAALRQTLHGTDYDTVRKFARESHQKLFIQVQKRQQNKMRNLIAYSNRS